ncbi:MAG: sulfate reduction electron transfer complex DsrMKJOP subunit DsrJ [Thermodesulfobacteriota bacterium]
MYNTGKIITGLVIFFVVFTFPFWFNGAKAVPAPKPSLDTPKINELKAASEDGTVTCLMPTEYMKSEHMVILNEWRTADVRRADYTASYNGELYPMSLSKTCMECHSNKADFCDRCHNYASVTPYCWNCHVEPKKAEGE